MGIAHAAIFECLDVDGVGIGVAEALGDLHSGVHGVVVTNVAAKEADDDGARIVVSAHGF